MTPGSAIYLARHGHVGPDHARRYLGKTDWPLSPEGLAQAECLRQGLAGVCFHRILTSDLIRARQTAERIALGRDVAVELVPELGEIDMGEWETLTHQQVRERFPAASAQRDHDLFRHRPPGGESLADLNRRVIPVFDRIATEAVGNILIVAHAGVNRLILCHALGMPPQHLFRIGQEYGALNCIERRGRDYRVTRLNWTFSPA